MNRLAARLALAMVGVVLIAIALTVASQFALLRQQFLSLPESVRGEIETIVRSPGPPDADDRDRLEAVFLAWLEEPAAREAIVETLLATREPGAQAGFLVAALLATAVAAGVGIVAAARIARPISAVTDAAGRLREGDLTARVARPARAAAARRAAPYEAAPYEVERLARDFDAMAATLERLEHERTRLIADVAHELRTPLAVLQGRLEGMVDGVIRTVPAELERLHRQTAHLTRLVEDLRVLSLADAERLTLHREPMDLVPWAREVVRGFGHVADARGVALGISAEADAIVVPADRERLTQVLSNLLDNAVRATPEHGRVEVRLGFTGDGARLIVADEGPGLSPAEVERIFERFYRSEDSASERASGSGLGLAIVRSLVEAHGGHVRAARRASGGARIEVSLPALGERGS